MRQLMLGPLWKCSSQFGQVILLSDWSVRGCSVPMQYLNNLLHLCHVQDLCRLWISTCQQAFPPAQNNSKVQECLQFPLNHTRRWQHFVFHVVTCSDSTVSSPTPVDSVVSSASST